MTTSSTGTPPASGPPFAGFAPSRPRRFGLVQLADSVAASSWFFVVAVAGMPAFAGMTIITLVRYALAGYFLLGLFLYPSRLLPVAARGWPVFLLPVMCIISSLWAPYQSDAIRKGILLGMTGIVSIYYAGKISPRTFFYGYFAAEFVCMVLSYLNPVYDGADMIGAFNQKNVLAMNMFFLYATGLTLALDTGMALRWRALGALAMPLALVLIVLSRSATTMAMTAVCTAGLFVQAFIWQPASRVRHVRSFLILLGAMLVSVVGLLVFGILALDAESGVLSLLGKDSTLTGRTYLWDQARQIMHDHPLTGVGANGFWHPERGQADSITKYFHYDTFVPFNFHNSYFENGVQLGYPGMYATIVLACWGLFYAARTWIQKQDLFNMTFLMLAGLIVVRSNTEIDLAIEFSTVILLQVAGMRRNEKTPAVTQPVIAARPEPQGRER
jgi:exopolysaccharide production protein ExoQ